MRKITGPVWAALCGAFMVALLPMEAAQAQARSAGMPDNASAGKYGGGWECDRGYRERGGDCTAVDVPANAYATDRSYGLGWECMRGFRAVDKKACVPIAVPENGYLDASGDNWNCNRGYRKSGAACLAVMVPENGYFVDSPSGRGWHCDRGFRAVGDACVAVEVPQNAHLDYSGNAWECDRPYRRLQDNCTLP